MHRHVTPLHKSSPTLWKEAVVWKEDTTDFSSTNGMKKYKDWKIKVEQINAPKSSDYLVVYKLPCSLSKLQAFLMKNLTVTHEPSARPRPISWLALAISPKLPNGKDRKDDEDDVRVASQTFHDK